MVCSSSVWGANTCTEIIADGGFEQGVSPSSPWAQTSTNFGSPLCDPASCGASFDRLGGLRKWWAAFGWGLGPESVLPEEATLEQNITIPLGIAQLEFYLWNKSWVPSGPDFVRVRVDGVELFSVFATDPAYQAKYTPVILDLSAYADGMQHTLRFESVTNIDANIFIDDVARAPNEIFINYDPASKKIIHKNDQLQPVIDNTLISQEIRGQSITNKIDDISVNLSSAAAVLALRGGFGCDLGDNTGGNPSSVRSLTVSSGHVVAENIATWGGAVVPGLVVKGDGRFVAKNVVLR